jgi:hypothetical protein
MPDPDTFVSIAIDQASTWLAATEVAASRSLERGLPGGALTKSRACCALARRLGGQLDAWP